jgi:hypothetical protein
MLGADEGLDRLQADVRYGARRKNCTATSRWARSSAACENTRWPVKRQMMITLAKPSIAESSPNPTSAIEPAARPAAMATAPSTVIHASDSHESSRTRPASVS